MWGLICKQSSQVRICLIGVWSVRRKSEIKLRNEPNYLAEKQADPTSVKSDRGKLNIGALNFRRYFRTSPSEVEAQQYRRLTLAKDRSIEPLAPLGAVDAINLVFGFQRDENPIENKLYQGSINSSAHNDRGKVSLFLPRKALMSRYTRDLQTRPEYRRG